MKLFSILTLGILVSAPILAETPRFGLSGSLSQPQGEMKDFIDKTGFGAGAFVDVNMGSGHVLRPRFDYVYHPGNSQRQSVYDDGYYYIHADLSYSVNTAGVGMDYLYYVNQRPQGFYLNLGLAANRVELKAKASFVTNAPYIPEGFNGAFQDKSEMKIGYVMGLGYDFNKYAGMNVRYTSTQVDEDFTSNAINFGMTFRF